MKKATLLLALILISAIGFSQNKIGGNDPIEGIDIIIKKNPGSKPIINTENNPLIDEVNKLELEYLNLKAKEVQYGFGNQDFTKLKTKDEVFKEYIAYLQNKIAEEKPKVVSESIRVSERLRHKNRAILKKPGLEHKAGVKKGGNLKI